MAEQGAVGIAGQLFQVEQQLVGNTAAAGHGTHAEVIHLPAIGLRHQPAGAEQAVVEAGGVQLAGIEPGIDIGRVHRLGVIPKDLVNVDAVLGTGVLHKLADDGHGVQAASSVGAGYTSTPNCYVCLPANRQFPR